MPSPADDLVGGKTYTFVMYQLDVYNKEADIDVLCVAPSHVDREDYFTSFVELFKKQPEVTEIRAVEEAFIPVIQMNFDSIELNMLFAKLTLKEISDNMNFKDDMLLKNLDLQCVRSLKGRRVTEEILRYLFEILTFTGPVHLQATTAKTVEDGRRIDAKHVKRKQLSSYLPSNVLQCTKQLEGMSLSTSEKSK